VLFAGQITSPVPTSVRKRNNMEKNAKEKRGAILSRFAALLKPGVVPPNFTT
jgi:hypothetical protein